jgi:hypothetical protein
MGALALTGSLVLTSAAVADEGMWTFDNMPVKQLKENYDFTPSRAWLDHVRLSSVRFNDGGSGSFISPNGLVLTNHHVARGQLQKLSTSKINYVKKGFYASTQSQEAQAPDLELNVLMSFVDVTARVTGVVKKGMSDEEALKARKAEIARIEKASTDKTGLRSDVVTLYHGGEYWLYRYKKYTDIRLVFAPEVGIAFFGGDPDNFTFPRWALDMAIFRVYENGEPISSPDFLKVNPNGSQKGDLVFVSGHPGSTARLHTLAQLRFARDTGLPQRLEQIGRTLKTLEQYSARGVEQARQADGMTFGLLNAKKALTGQLQGLLDEHVWGSKEADEARFRKQVAVDAKLQARYGEAWGEIEEAMQTKLIRFQDYSFRRMPGYRLPRLALAVVRYVQEVAKANGERLDGYHDSQLESLRFRLFSPAPIYPELEEVLLAEDLQVARKQLGAKDAFVQVALDGKSAEVQAKSLIVGTRMASPALRKSLVNGGVRAVEASRDPLVVWARSLAPILREIHDWHEDKVESVVSAAGERLGAARFAVYGKSTYPDATFTLRLTYGTVKGYPMNGTLAPPVTTLYGLYDRYHSFGKSDPFIPPKRYLERQSQLDLRTPMNFVATCDIIGGNSGSPVINRAGELVGLIFDGNIESLVGRFVYDDRTNRAVSVHSAAMREAMTKLYDCPKLVREMFGS